MSLSRQNLLDRQSLPLEAKVVMTQARIREWYRHFDGDVYVSLSGGKDSCVLNHIVGCTSGVYDVPSVFCDTGLEYPEVRGIAMKYADIVLRPEMTFKQVIQKYGYPCISKEQAQYIREARHSTDKMRDLRINGRDGRFKISDKWMFCIDAPFEISEQCCSVMKKRPFKLFERETGRKPMVATMAHESSLRKQKYLRDGCNAFDSKRPMSTPMGFWTDQDVLRYILDNDVEYASVYGDIVETEDGLALTGETRTGCMFCMFGVQSEQCPNRFQRMELTHPRQYAYCMDKLGLRGVMGFLGIPCENDQLRLF